MQSVMPAILAVVMAFGSEDFSIWDLDAEYEIDPKDFLSMGKATPFQGWKVNGKCLLTVCDGKVVYQA